MLLQLHVGTSSEIHRYEAMSSCLCGTSANFMNLIQAWLHWFSGEKLPEDTTVCLVVCWKLLVWGRLGKFIQFMSATAIVADIIGAEKLREIGESLCRSFPIDASKQYFLKTARWLRELYEIVLLEDELKDISGGCFSGEISREEYEKQRVLILEKQRLHPYTRKEFEGFTPYLYRIFRRSLLDKLNVTCSLVILIIYGVPWARDMYSYMSSHEYMSMTRIQNPGWFDYLAVLFPPLILLFIVFLMALYFISPIVVSIIIFSLTFFVLLVDFAIIRRIA